MEFVEVLINDDNKINILVKLADAIWREHYKDILSEKQIDYMLDKFQSYDAIKQQLKDNYKYYLLFDNDYIGFIGYVLNEYELYLSKIYLLKEYRSKGNGKKAINYLVNKAKETNKERIVLNVNRYNNDSIKAYEALGFVKTRTEDNEIGEGYLMEDYVYEKNIL